MAKWRETRAYQLVIRWLSLPDAASTRLTGYVLTQDGARILAAVCDGDLEPIKRLVLNRNADEFSRGVAVAALALLAVWAEVPRDIIVDYFAWLAREGLEREPSYVWSALASESADTEALATLWWARLEGLPQIAELRSWHWPRLASSMTMGRWSRTGRRRRSDAMSRAPVAAGGSTRSAAEGERVNGGRAFEVASKCP